MRNTLHRNVGGQRVELFCFAWWFLAQILSGTDANRLPMDLAAGSDSRRRAGPSSRRRQEVAGSFPGRPSRRATSSASGTATSSPASTPHTPLTCASWPATAPASAGAVIVASQSAGSGGLPIPTAAGSGGSTATARQPWAQIAGVPSRQCYTARSQ
jgi:hypothetical protein